MTRLFIAHRVEKIRLTGGEPLLRKNCVVLIGMLAALKTPGGKPLYLTPTTTPRCWPGKSRRSRPRVCGASASRSIRSMKLYSAP